MPLSCPLPGAFSFEPPSSRPHCGLPLHPPRFEAPALLRLGRLPLNRHCWRTARPHESECEVGQVVVTVKLRVNLRSSTASRKLHLDLVVIEFVLRVNQAEASQIFELLLWILSLCHPPFALCVGDCPDPWLHSVPTLRNA